MTNYTITHHVTLTTMECSECHIAYAIPEDLKRRALDNSDVSWRCPNGHSQVYGDSTIDKLRQKVAQQEREINQANSARDTWMKSAQKYKGELETSEAKAARLKRRVANGVCPCCKRTFKQLSKHMEGQHPDYVLESKLK